MLLPDLEQRIAGYRKLARDNANAATTRYLMPAAAERDIPCRYFPLGTLRYGQGRYQRETRDAFTDRTGFLAVQLSSNKASTSAVLGTAGLPVAAQAVVGDWQQAVEAAYSLGYPVVVKPVSTDRGSGVSVGLTTAAEVKAAYDKARPLSPAVLIERFVPGDDHRLLVVDGRLVAAAKRIPGQVIGDGRRSVADLVEAVNRDPRRGQGHENVLTRLELDEEARALLGERGLGPDAIPGCRRCHRLAAHRQPFHRRHVARRHRSRSRGQPGHGPFGRRRRSVSTSPASIT